MTSNSDPQSPPPVSSYQAYLPAVLQGDEFLGQFLLAFERILSGFDSEPMPKLPQIIQSSETLSSKSEDNKSEDDKSEDKTYPPGLEQVIDQIHTYLSPKETPKDFLPWLAKWVALSLRNDWDVPTKQQFISKIVPLYRLRGTKQGLRTVLALYLNSVKLPDKVDIFEFPDHPHYFQVQLLLPTPDPSRYWRQIRIARAIIDQEKPAHTSYRLRIRVPTMRLTGHFFPVVLQAGTIKAQIQTNVDMSQIRLSIKSKLGEEPIAIAGNDRSVTYTIPSEATTSQHPWYVVIDYFGDKELLITLQISTESGGETSKDLTLQPPLKLGRNTTLGTEPGQVRQN